MTNPITPMTTFEGQDNYNYYSGTSITLHVNPFSGWRFDHFRVASTGVNIYDNPWQTNIGSSLQVHIYYAKTSSGTSNSSMATYLQIADGTVAAVGALLNA